MCEDPVNGLIISMTYFHNGNGQEHMSKTLQDFTPESLRAELQTLLCELDPIKGTLVLVFTPICGNCKAVRLSPTASSYDILPDADDWSVFAQALTSEYLRAQDIISSVMDVMSKLDIGDVGDSDEPTDMGDLGYFPYVN